MRGMRLKNWFGDTAAQNFVSDRVKFDLVPVPISSSMMTELRLGAKYNYFLIFKFKFRDNLHSGRAELSNPISKLMRLFPSE